MQRTRDEWNEIVRGYQASGLTVRHFCQSAGVAQHSLRYWIKRINGSSWTSPDAAQGLVEIGPTVARVLGNGTLKHEPDHSCHRNGLAIRFCGGAVVEVNPDTDMNMLARVLAVMVSLK